MKLNFKERKGITLISLVITIVILLILAGITINSLTGENGLFTRAKEAKEKTQYSHALEEINLTIMQAQLLSNGDMTLEDIIKVLKDDEDYTYVIKFNSTALLSDSGDIKQGDITEDGLNEELRTQLSTIDAIYVTHKGYEFKINKELEVENSNKVGIEEPKEEVLEFATEINSITEVQVNSNYVISIDDITDSTIPLTVQVNGTEVTLPYTLNSSTVQNYTITYISNNTNNSIERTIKYYKNYTITNKLGTAGNFENSGWSSATYSNTHVKYGSYALKISGTTSLVENTVTSSSTYLLDPSHKYYMSVEIYQESKVESMQMYWPVQEPCSLGGLVTNAGQWCKTSAVINRSSFSSGSHYIRLDFNNNYKTGAMWYDGAVLVDLTSIFGSGNEPNKTWCDQNLDYFSSSKTVKYVK